MEKLFQKNLLCNYKFFMPQFLILAEDYKDNQALKRRLSVREAHLTRVRLEKAEGRFVIGGAKLNEQGNMHGSMLVVQLESKEAVYEWIKEDPYVTGEVWERVEVLHLKVADV
jgi:uncharacterized protein YciI